MLREIEIAFGSGHINRQGLMRELDQLVPATMKGHDP
jgi:hypothetical protein